MKQLSIIAKTVIGDANATNEQLIGLTPFDTAPQSYNKQKVALDLLEPFALAAARQSELIKPESIEFSTGTYLEQRHSLVYAAIIQFECLESDNDKEEIENLLCNQSLEFLSEVSYTLAELNDVKGIEPSMIRLHLGFQDESNPPNPLDFFVPNPMVYEFIKAIRKHNKDSLEYEINVSGEIVKLSYSGRITNILAPDESIVHAQVKEIAYDRRRLKIILANENTPIWAFYKSDLNKHIHLFEKSGHNRIFIKLVIQRELVFDNGTQKHTNAHITDCLGVVQGELLFE